MRTEGEAISEDSLPSPAHDPVSVAQNEAGLGSNSKTKDTVG